MRHVSRTHRVNFAWLYDIVQNDGSAGIKYINAKQQSADSLTTGFTQFETWSTLLSILAVFRMNKQLIAKTDPESCTAAIRKDMFELLWKCRTR